MKLFACLDQGDTQNKEVRAGCSRVVQWEKKLGSVWVKSVDGGDCVVDQLGEFVSFLLGWALGGVAGRV